MNKDNFIKTTAYDVLSELSDEDVVYIADNADNLDELIASLHFSLGSKIRNDYIHGKNLCFDDEDEIEPDDLSSEIIKYIVYLIKSKDIYEKADKNNLLLSSEELNSYNEYESYLIAKDKKIKDKALSLYKDASVFCMRFVNDEPINSEEAKKLYVILTRINSKICDLPKVEHMYHLYLEGLQFGPFISLEKGDKYYYCEHPNNNQVSIGSVSEDLSKIVNVLEEYVNQYGGINYINAISYINEEYGRIRNTILRVLYVLCNIDK